MVRIAIDFEDAEWKQRALRVLAAGGDLIRVPEDRVEPIVDSSRGQGIDVDVEEPEGGRGGWSLHPG